MTPGVNKKRGEEFILDGFARKSYYYKPVKYSPAKIFISLIFIGIHAASNKIPCGATGYYTDRHPKNRSLCSKITYCQPDDSPGNSEYTGCFTFRRRRYCFTLMLELAEMLLMFFAMV
jgi:hypothetical protein